LWRCSLDMRTRDLRLSGQSSVQQSTKVELTDNLTATRTLGPEHPRVDEVDGRIARSHGPASRPALSAVR
jgi:hypothetical protein